MANAKLLVAFIAAFCVIASAANLDALRPPKGSAVALIVFEDLECPKCAHDHPVLEQAAQKYGIPLVIHDFPLPSQTPPFHAWSREAAITARYFAAKSPELGKEFREYVFRNQPSIGNNPARYQGVAQQFAREHHTELPFAVDPQGTFASEVEKDRALGLQLGINSTPTIYLSTNQANVQPTRVDDVTNVYQMIEAAKRATANETPAPKKPTGRKK